MRHEMEMKMKPQLNARRRQAIFNYKDLKLDGNFNQAYDVFAQQYEGQTRKFQEYRKQVDLLEQQDRRSRTHLNVQKQKLREDSFVDPSLSVDSSEKSLTFPNDREIHEKSLTPMFDENVVNIQSRNIAPQNFRTIPTKKLMIPYQGLMSNGKVNSKIEIQPIVLSSRNNSESQTSLFSTQPNNFC